MVPRDVASVADIFITTERCATGTSAPVTLPVRRAVGEWPVFARRGRLELTNCVEKLLDRGVWR